MMSESSGTKSTEVNSGAPAAAAPEGTGYQEMNDDTENQQMTIDQKLENAHQMKSGRQGHLFCGRFCDMRIAVVVLSVINILILLIGGIVTVVKYGWGGLGAHFPGFVLSCIGIYGALSFEFWAVCLAAIGYTVGLLFDIIWMNWMGLIIGSIVLYPHVVLCKELNDGIMSRETYSREEYIDPVLASAGPKFTTA